MAKKDKHVSETPATQLLKAAGVTYTEHPYDYVDHGGTAESARQLGVPEHEVIKTLVMQHDQRLRLVVLHHQGLDDRMFIDPQLGAALGRATVRHIAVHVLGVRHLVGLQPLGGRGGADVG